MKNMRNEICIRPLAEDDGLRAVSRIYAESWRAAYCGIVPQAYLDRLSDAAWMPAPADTGLRQVYLWVLEDHQPARRFYEKQGFVPGGERTACVIKGKELWELRYIRISERT